MQTNISFPFISLWFRVNRSSERCDEDEADSCHGEKTKSETIEAHLMTPILFSINLRRSSFQLQHRQTDTENRRTQELIYNLCHVLQNKTFFSSRPFLFSSFRLCPTTSFGSVGFCWVLFGDSFPIGYWFWKSSSIQPSLESSSAPEPSPNPKAPPPEGPPPYP